MKLTKEQLAKAMACKNVDELMALAQNANIELTKEDAEKYFAQLSGKELNLDDIADVAGGCNGNVCVGNISAVC